MSDRTTISMPEGMLDQVKSIADSESRSVSSMIQIFIKEGVSSRGSEITPPVIKKPIVLKQTKKLVLRRA